MRNLAIIVPFKGVKKKSRLSGSLGAQLRDRLSFMMLEHVTGTLARMKLSRACFVVSSDDRALEVASKVGGTPVKEVKDAGVNAAVQYGIQASGGSEFLVLPADLPLLRQSDVKAVLDFTLQGLEVVISPSKSFNGTNLLYFSRDAMLALSYDSNSFWNHLAGAARLGKRTGVYAGTGVTFDVDTIADVKDLARLRSRTGIVALAQKALM